VDRPGLYRCRAKTQQNAFLVIQSAACREKLTERGDVPTADGRKTKALLSWALQLQQSSGRTRSLRKQNAAEAGRTLEPFGRAAVARRACPNRNQQNMETRRRRLRMNEGTIGEQVGSYNKVSETAPLNLAKVVV